MDNIQYSIDDILINKMGTNGYMNTPQEGILKRELAREGFSEAEICAGIRHYEGLD